MSKVVGVVSGAVGVVSGAVGVVYVRTVLVCFPQDIA